MVPFIQYVVLFSAESVESSEVTIQMKPLQQDFRMLLLIIQYFSENYFFENNMLRPSGSIHGMTANLFLGWRLSMSFLCWWFIGKQIPIIFFLTIINKQVNLFR